ncbi:MAG: efflux RND transporter periplasmic adaptor subunit [Alphaproteobacteria bacterium]|nr:efflux RND transporter periplasmic adaptor subunit [Alphaproteobacteria bacterium]
MDKIINKKYVWIILIALFIAFFIFRFYKNNISVNMRHHKEVSVSVNKATVTKMQTILEFIGTAVSNESVDITSSITQKITDIKFSECTLVKKGDVLVQLNVDKQKAILKQAEINLEEQQRELNRLSGLKDKKIIAEKEYDLQNTKLLNAQAQIEEIKEEIKEGTIVAPFDGMLGIRYVSVGALLTPGTVITTLDNIRKIKVDFSVPEKYFSLINKQCKITATSIAMSGREFFGNVHAVSPRISPVSRSFSVRAIINNDEYLLRPGMLLNVTIEMQDRDAIMIPESAVFSIGEKHYVFRLTENNKVKQTFVEIGLRRGGLVEISKGIQANDQIVTEGVVKLSDGDTVSVKNSVVSEKSESI